MTAAIRVADPGRKKFKYRIRFFSSVGSGSNLKKRVLVQNLSTIYQTVYIKFEEKNISILGKRELRSDLEPVFFFRLDSDLFRLERIRFFSVVGSRSGLSQPGSTTL